jgi:hypothetical protein
MVDDPQDPRNRAARITDAYNRAQEARQQQKAAPRQESEMVRKDAPGMHLRPDGPMRAQADRQAFNDRLDAEKKQRAEDLKKQLQERKGQDPQRDRDPDRGR